MSVHELATNAAKHGAWQGNGGTVRISWSVQDDELTFEWQETCERVIEPPVHAGFGSRLLQQTIAYELQGKVEAVYTKMASMRSLPSFERR